VTATFVYATPGAEGLRQAIRYLNGEKVEKNVVLCAATNMMEAASIWVGVSPEASRSEGVARAK
jgi:hypothetical protein